VPPNFEILVVFALSLLRALLRKMSGEKGVGGKGGSAKTGTTRTTAKRRTRRRTTSVARVVLPLPRLPQLGYPSRGARFLRVSCL